LSLERSIPREELVGWVREKLAALEEECRMLKAILETLEGRTVQAREEREPVLYGKKRIAWLHQGPGYVRLTPEYPLRLPREALEYLEEAVSRIREKQSDEGVPEEERARLDVANSPDGSIAEARISGLHTSLDVIRAKAALKYIAELGYELYKARGAQ